MKIKQFILLLILTGLWSQADIGFSYELKYGDGTSITNQGSTEEPYNYFENLLDVNVLFPSGVSFWGQLEYSDPPVFGSKFDGLNKFYFEYNQKNTIIRVGDIYSMHGLGLSLNTTLDQNIDFDNSLRGIEFDYSLNDNSRLFAVLGKSRFDFRSNPAQQITDRWLDTKAYSAGYEIDLSAVGIFQLFFLNQESRLDESMLPMYYEERKDTRIGREFAERVTYEDYRSDTLTSRIMNMNWSGTFDFFDIYLEYERNIYTKILGNEIPGSKLYASLFTQIGPVGITYELKDYDTPYFIQSLNNAPIVYREATSILSSRYNHSISFGDERGHQLEFQMPLGDYFNWMMNIAQSNRHVGPNTVYSYDAIFDPDSVDINEAASNIESLSSYVWSSGVESVENYNHPGFFNLFSMDYSNEAIAYRPFRQFYSEVSGYLADNKIFFQVGIDKLNDVTKYHDTKTYVYNMDEISQQAVETFLDTVSTIWQTNQLTPYQADITSLEDMYDEFLFFCAGDPSCAETFFQTTYHTTISYQDSLNDLTELLNDAADSVGVVWQEKSSGILQSDDSRNFEYENHQVLTIPLRFSWNMGNGGSISSYWEHQWRDYESNRDEESAGIINFQLTQVESYYNQYLTLSYRSPEKWTVTLFYDGETHTKKIGSEVYSDKYQEWTGIDFSVDMSSSSAISLFYGSQKGGRICANGICADQPGFKDGFKVTYRSFF